MGQNKRHTPAVPDRQLNERWVFPRYTYVPGPPEVAPAPANVVIAFRYGRDVLRGLEAFVVPQYQRFPYFEQPANPPIYFRYGTGILVAPQAFVPAQYYQRFPYFEQPRNPFIPFRYGQDILNKLDAWVEPHYHRFPYSPTVNPVITFRYGQAALRELSDYTQAGFYHLAPFGRVAAATNRAAQLLGQRPPRTDPKRLRARIQRKPH